MVYDQNGGFMELKYSSMSIFAFRALVTIVAIFYGMLYFGMDVPESGQHLYVMLIDTPEYFIFFGWLNILAVISNAGVVWCLDAYYCKRTGKHTLFISGFGYIAAIILGVSNYTSIGAIGNIPEEIATISPEIMATFKLLDVGLGSMALVSMVFGMAWMVMYGLKTWKEAVFDGPFAVATIVLGLSHLLLLFPLGQYLALVADLLWSIWGFVYFKNVRAESK